MTSVVLVSASDELGRRFRTAAGSAPFTQVTGPTPRSADELVSRAAVPWPAAVVAVDAATDPGAALHLAAQLNLAHPTIGLVLVGPSELALPALRAGVRDVCRPDADPVELAGSLTLAARIAGGRAQVPSAPTGRVISVLSPKGGVGKTTVASNIAIGLALRDPNSTVVVDLDIQFGDIATALDLEPEFFLADTVRGAARQDAMVLKSFLSRHRTGLYAICAPASPAEADELTVEDITHLIRTLKTQFRNVVLDTAPGLSEHTLAALDETTEPVLVTSMDVPGVRGLRKELQTLHALGLLPDRRQIVLNLAERRSLLTVADVEATIEAPIDVVLPRSKAAAASVNQGIPLLQSRNRDPLTRQLDRLVDRLLSGTSTVHGAPAPSPVPVRRTGRDRAPVAKRAATRWQRAAAPATAKAAGR